MSGSNVPDVTIQWTAFTDTPTGTVGRTDVLCYPQDNTVISAKVMIDQTLPNDFQVQVIAHELRHALGIDGHSTDSADLMYAVAHLPATVTLRDQNTILGAYAVADRAQKPSPLPTGLPAGMVRVVQYLCGPE